MSQCKWHIYGVGVNLDNIRFDPDRVIKCLKNMDPEMDEDSLKAAYAEYAYSGAFYALQNVVDEYTHFSPTDIVYNACCLGGDESSCLSCTTDGSDSYYLFLEPVYPWEASEKYPKSLAEARQAIISTLQVLSSMTEEEIDAVIDEDLDIACQG